MGKNSVFILVAAALALAACQPAGEAKGQAGEQSQVAAADQGAAATAAAQTELEAAFLGKATPPYPEGFTEQGGHLEDSNGSEIWVVYGRWAHAGAEQGVMFVQRTTGTTPANARGQLPAEIVSVYAMPTARANEIIFTENCLHPDYPEPASRIYANASTTQLRPGMSDPPSAAWRLDRASARLLPIDAAQVTCGFDHME